MTVEPASGIKLGDQFQEADIVVDGKKMKIKFTFGIEDPRLKKFDANRVFIDYSCDYTAPCK